jgi:ubiquinone/menaquinone biosynthesis C-methylase UbiE
LQAALRDDGVNLEAATPEGLAPYDQFHGRGLEATTSLADRLAVSAHDHLLDVGSGLGGPARYFAERFACRVTGVDLTAEFCDVATRLNYAVGLDERVSIKCANALSLPFPDQSFDGAYSMNVSMNIENKLALYAELRRVLKPDGWLLLSELARGATGHVEYPTPWAKTAAESFLASPEQTRVSLTEAGFDVIWLEDSIAATREFAARSKEMLERGEKPTHRAVTLIHGDVSATASSNTARASKAGALIPIEVYSTRTTA